MTVLYLTANPNRASSNVPVEGWFRCLRPLGLKPVIVSPRSGTFQAWARAEGVPVYEVAFPLPDVRRPWPYARALWQMRAIAKRHDVKIVHAIEHNVYPFAGDVARTVGRPALVGIHSRIDPGFGSWAFGGRRCPDRLLFLSHGSQAVCRGSVAGVVPEDRWRLLYNGLDVEQIRPDAAAGLAFRQQHHLGAGPLIGAASWLRPGKQLEHLVEVTSRLSDLEFTLLVAGGVAPGEEEYAAAFLQSARDCLGPRLRYLGYLDDLRGFYNALDFSVNTSKEETCSISVMESLACGCPVVGYPSVSVDEQVLPDGGTIVGQDDVGALAAAVRHGLTASEARAAARAGARRRAEAVFDIRPVSLQLWREYGAVMAARGAAA